MVRARKSCPFRMHDQQALAKHWRRKFEGPGWNLVEKQHNRQD